MLDINFNATQTKLWVIERFSAISYVAKVEPSGFEPTTFLHAPGQFTLEDPNKLRLRFMSQRRKWQSKADVKDKLTFFAKTRIVGVKIIH